MKGSSTSRSGFSTSNSPSQEIARLSQREIQGGTSEVAGSRGLRSRR